MREALVALVVALPFGAGIATGASADGPAPVFRFQDPAIVESSGLALVDGLVITVNDSGDEARVFAVDPATGRTVGVTRWQGGAEDVEALAPAGDGRVWVADIGDNTASRDQVSVIRVPIGEGEQDVAGERFALRYAEGPADAEALLTDPDDGRLVLVTKGVFGGQVYVAPRALRTDGVTTLQPRGRVMPVVTDGAFTPDGEHLVLRDYSRAVVYTWPELEAVEEIRLPTQRQGEGLVVTDDDTLLLSSEGARAPVYEVALPDLDVADEAPPASYSREGQELPDQQVRQRDRTQWYLGIGLAVAAVAVLLVSLRPR